jgi:hypothetical protein
VVTTLIQTLIYTCLAHIDDPQQYGGQIVELKKQLPQYGPGETDPRPVWLRTVSGDYRNVLPGSIVTISISPPPTASDPHPAD